MFYQLDTTRGIKGERVLPYTNGAMPDIVLAFDRLCLSGSFSYPLTVIAYPNHDDRYRVIHTRPCCIPWSELESADLYDKKRGSYNADIILQSANVEVLFAAPFPKSSLKKISARIYGERAKPTAYIPQSYDITTTWGKLLDDFYHSRLTDIWGDGTALVSCELNGNVLNIQVCRSSELVNVMLIEDAEQIEGVYISKNGKYIAEIDPDSYADIRQLYHAIAANIASSSEESNKKISVPTRWEPTFRQLSSELRQMEGKKFRQVHILDKMLYLCSMLLIGYLVSLVKYSIVDKAGASTPILIFLGATLLIGLLGEGLIRIFEHDTVAVTNEDGIYYLAKKTNSENRFELVHARWSDINEIYAFAKFKRVFMGISLRLGGFHLGLLIDTEKENGGHDGQLTDINLIRLIASIKAHKRSVKLVLDKTTLLLPILFGVIIGLLI